MVRLRDADPGGPNYGNAWQVCANSQCIGWNQHNSSCNCGASWPDKDRTRYIAYNGVFPGWVGVEAFTHVATSTLLPDGDYPAAYFGLFDMVPDGLLP